MLHINNKTAPHRSGKTFLVAVRYQKDFDVAIVIALLGKLGLNRPGLLESFNRQYFRDNFFLFCVNQIRNQQNLLTYYTQQARAFGQVNIPINVQIALAELIARFFNEIIGKVAERFMEFQNRLGLSSLYAAYGITKDTQESFTDAAQGLKKIVGGFWDGNISAVGSQKFNDGWNRFFAGIAQTGIGCYKFGFQMPLDAFTTIFVNNISAFQTLFALESLGRLLTQDETNLLKSVFGGSLEYSAIRIKEGYAGAFSAGMDQDQLMLINNNRAITICNTIYMKNTNSTDWDSVLVHETTHVRAISKRRHRLYVRGFVGAGNGWIRLF